jgi:two-component system, OmpR family, response regulator VicR
MATVLIADDEMPICELLAELLADLGYSTVTAANGQQALQRLNALAAPPALIISDVMMPQMSGVELARAVRAMPQLRNVPIVLMSAAPHLVDEGEADALIVKPFNLDDLLRVIQSMLPAQRAA